MKKATATVAAILMAATVSGCAATETERLVQKDAMNSAAATTELTRVYFDTLECEVKVGETATVHATVTGGAVSYRSLSPAVATVTADGETVTITGVKAGTTYLLAMDAAGCEHNACRITVTGKSAPITDPADTVSNRGMTYGTYNLGTYLFPYWRGDTVYNETALMVGETDGTPLLYPATRILQVSSYDHKTVYEEGRDYTYDSKTNILRRTAGSRIPYTPTDDWYFTADRATALGTVAAFPYKDHDGKYLFFAEGSTISQKQISISYEHAPVKSGDWTVVPSREGDFARLHAKLAAKRDIGVLYYGDSVVYGANASGQVDCGLHAPTYTQMISAYMREKYGVKVTEQNAATGGTRSDQGVRYFPNYRTGLQADGQTTYQGEAITVTPDLVVLGYGLNDSAQGRTTAQFAESMDTLVKAARQKWPSADILVVSPTLGNPEVFIYQDNDALEQALLDWYGKKASEYGGVAVAQVTSMYRQLYHRKGNRYRDFTGNNVNHPNDTGTRMIAQVCLHTIFGEDYFA